MSAALDPPHPHTNMRYLFSSFILLFSLLSPLHACFPITHIVLCELWMDANTNFNAQDRHTCILGTLFPDIRQLGVVSREATHVPNVTLEKMRQNTDPFSLGMQLHSFVDEFEHRFVKRNAAKGLVSDLPNEDRYALLEILQDEILYPTVDVEQVLGYLSTVIPEEREMNIHSTFIYVWHGLLKRYIGHPPNHFIRHLARTHQNFHYASRATVKLWDQKLEELSQREEIQDFVNELVSSFKEAISDTPTPQ